MIGKGGIGGLMKQAQKMQEEMQKAQAEVAAMEATGNAGGGMVSITINGAHECKRVKLDPSVLEDDDQEMLEDLIAAAFNDASQRLASQSQERMASVTAGMQMPPGFKMPF